MCQRCVLQKIQKLSTTPYLTASSLILLTNIHGGAFNGSLDQNHNWNTFGKNSFLSRQHPDADTKKWEAWNKWHDNSVRMRHLLQNTLTVRTDTAGTSYFKCATMYMGFWYIGLNKVSLNFVLHCIYSKIHFNFIYILYTWVRASWIEFNNCPTRCDLFSLLLFCRQLYMFRVLTPIIMSSYNCKYSFWYWLTAMSKIRCY